MSTTPNGWDATLEWLTFGVATLSTMFVGLIWWLARQRLRTRFIFRAGQVDRNKLLHGIIEIYNRGDSEIKVEAISVSPPLHLLVDDRGHVYGQPATTVGPYKPAQEASYDWLIKPESSPEQTILLSRDGGFESCKKVSIRLHILKSFPVIHQKKKVLTAILPASIRSAQE